MTIHAFNIFGLAFLLGLFLLSVDGIANMKHVSHGKPDHWLLRDKNISKSCEASQLPSGHTYTISWYLGTNQDDPMMNTSNQIITSFRTGNTLTSTIVLKNVTRFPQIEKAYTIDCHLVRDGKKTRLAIYLEFVPLQNKNMPSVAITVLKSNVDYDQEIKLNCTVRGNLITEKLDIEWRKDGKLLKSSKQSKYGEEVNLPLIIERAEGSSGGVYICNASIGKLSHTVLFQANDTVSVVVFPKLIGPKKKVDNYFKIGDKVNVLCDIDGYPLSITWQKKSSEGILENVSDGGHFQLKDNGKTLTIDRFQSGDATDFVCKSKDKNGTDIVQTTTLTEKVEPSIRSDAVEKSVTLIPGQQFSLECDIHAVPPCITWSIYEPEKLTKSDVTDLTPGVVPPTSCSTTTLRITNVTAFADGQIFSCSDGDVVQNISAVIPTKPHLYGPSPKEVKVEEGDDATLICNIAVYPLNITWSVDGHTLSASNKRYMISSVDPRIVDIKDVDYDDRKSFYCSAKNILDPKGVEQEIILRVKDPNAALWPAIGIGIAAVVVAIIIGVSWYIKKRKDRRENDTNKRGTERQDGEAEQPLVTELVVRDHQDGKVES